MSSIFEIANIGKATETFRNAAGEIEYPAQNLLDALVSAKCESIVLERDYVDLDFKAGYGRFYHVHHRKTDRWCTRIHFFACQVREEDLYLMSPATKAAYLGYSVVRPLPTHKAGRTVLSESVLTSMYPGLYSAEQRFLTCSATHTVNIAGNRIEFRGVPWMQQDKLIAACASASIWTANWHLSHLYPHDFRRFTTTQITDLAVRFSVATGRGIPTDGLQVEQMLSALNGMGYEPLLQIPRTALACRRAVYHYVESGIPIIAIVAFPNQGAFEYHAVTIVGHTLALKPDIKRTAYSFRGRKRYRSYTSDYIPRFIAQDDSCGPFRFSQFLHWNQLSKRATRSRVVRTAKQHFSCGVLFDAETSRRELGFVFALLVPVPKRVTLQGNAAERNAERLVEKLFLRELKSKNIVYRTFLQPSNDFKRWWGPKATGEGRPAEVGISIRTHNFPNWCWVTEFADDRDLREAGRVLGQVIQDSSGRGTHAPWDDIVAIVGPALVALFPADPQLDPLVSSEKLSEAIKQFRKSDLTDDEQ